MADQRPDDHNVAGLTHDLPCVACGCCSPDSFGLDVGFCRLLMGE